MAAGATQPPEMPIARQVWHRKRDGAPVEIVKVTTRTVRYMNLWTDRLVRSSLQGFLERYRH